MIVCRKKMCGRIENKMCRWAYVLCEFPPKLQPTATANNSQTHNKFVKHGCDKGEGRERTTESNSGQHQRRQQSQLTASRIERKTHPKHPLPCLRKSRPTHHHQSGTISIPTPQPNQRVNQTPHSCITPQHIITQIIDVVLLSHPSSETPVSPTQSTNQPINLLPGPPPPAFAPSRPAH